LMQGNGQAVQLMETELTKSTDPGSNSWLDRFREEKSGSADRGVQARQSQPDALRNQRGAGQAIQR